MAVAGGVTVPDKEGLKELIHTCVSVVPTLVVHWTTQQ